MFAGAACRLSPGAALAQQAAVVGLGAVLAGVQATCAAPLLSDPLSVRRMAALHRLLDATDLLSALVPAGAGRGGGTSQRCAALALLHVLAVGILLPVALAWRSEPLPPLEEPAEPAPRPARRPWPGGGGTVGGGGAWAAVLRDVRSSPVALSLAAWLLFSNTWLLCKVAASRLVAENEDGMNEAHL